MFRNIKIKENLIRSLIILLAGLLFLAGSLYAQCSMDSDCKGDRVCVDGQCVSIRQAEQDQTEEEQVAQEQREKAENQTLPRMTLWFNPMGFMQYGPTAGVEYRVTEYTYVGVHARYATMGYLYNKLLVGFFDDDDEVWAGSGAVGAGSKYYMPIGEGTHSFYYGFFSEYMWGGHTEYAGTSISVDGKESPHALYTTRHQSLGLGATLGFRWWLGQKRQTLLTLGLMSGVAREIVDDWKYPDNSTAAQPLDNVFFAMVELAIGRGFYKN